MSRIRSQAPAMRGFSLIEMMISMLLGLLVLGAAIAVFASNRATYQANQGLGRIQENARVAFEMMARDLRSAGGTPCSGLSKPEPTAITGQWWSAFPSQPILGYGQGAFTGSRAGTDALQIMSSADNPIGIEGHTSTTLTLRTTNHGFVANDVLLVCDSNKVFLIKATAVSGKVITHAGLPDGYDFFYNDLSSEASVAVAGFAPTRWYVKANGRGTNSLYQVRTGGEDEVAEGVDDLDLTYLESGETAYGDQSTVANWGQVVAVRVDLGLSARDSRGNLINRSIQNVVSLRARTL